LRDEQHQCARHQVDCPLVCAGTGTVARVKHQLQCAPHRMAAGWSAQQWCGA
jgi:hypothetical protein